MDFNRLGENELSRLDDDKLIAYAVAAREDGANGAVRAALGVIAFRRYDDVKRRVAMKVPVEDIEDVAMQAVESAMKAAFSGEATGQFISLLHTVTERRIADFHKKGERILTTDPLPEENLDDEGVFGKTPSVEGNEDATVMGAVIDQALSELSPAHQAVCRHYLTGASAKETAEVVNISMGEDLETEMTEANAYQITKRFRDRIRELLEDEWGTG